MVGRGSIKVANGDAVAQSRRESNSPEVAAGDRLDKKLADQRIDTLPEHAGVNVNVVLGYFGCNQGHVMEWRE